MRRDSQSIMTGAQYIRPDKVDSSVLSELHSTGEHFVLLDKVEFTVHKLLLQVDQLRWNSQSINYYCR